MKGLINLGNTCYLNSGLQLIFHNKELMNIILLYAPKSEILNKISNIIIEYNSNNNNIINPIEIKNIIEQQQNIFYGSHQHDATELIIYLLNIINNEIIKINNLDILKQLYNVEIKTRIKCKLLKCLNININTENNYFLFLDILSNSTLHDLYNNYQNKEKLENDNAYNCDKCKRKTIASKRIKISNISNHLLIILKRFTNINNKLTKNNEIITIPLNFNNMILKGAIIHYGSLYSGHYIYIGKYKNIWYSFNDSIVTTINDNEINNYLNYAYLLYYYKN